ncbi:hypothetical protein PIB30_098478 [Stylosanthes scabra]|uniref:Uncharacterized protein n=1 Tax=Stylosanthes scabra TaxID=79078 RepID=A0ABU6TZM9_9FABA|nr:hypothetical protein [Stylosanthes scabra]
MALTDDYEPVRASLLHQNPLPSLEDALPRLKSKETRLGLTRSKCDNVFAATNKKGHLITACPTCPPRSDQNKYHPRPNYSQNVPASTAAATESTNPYSLNPPSVSDA